MFIPLYDSLSMTIMGHSHDTEPPISQEELITKLLISTVLVLLGGLFAGLTIGLMSLDTLSLKVLAQSAETERERKSAKRVLRLLDGRRHWCLVVLLLGNVIVNESLPIFLDSVLGGGVAAVVASTSAIVIFGEIVPQSVCARYGLAIGAFFSPFVLLIMYAFAPVAYPIAIFLDYMLGIHDTSYRKEELRSLVNLHREGVDPLNEDEVAIMDAVLSLNDKPISALVTSIKDVFTLGLDTTLDEEMIDKIMNKGFSRIPVHVTGEPMKFVGTLLVKRLVKYDAKLKKTIGQLGGLGLLPEALPTTNCFQALNYLQLGRSHLLLVTERAGSTDGVIGVLSLEDIMEEIIGEEIIDETDVWQDNQSKKPVSRLWGRKNQPWSNSIFERAVLSRPGSFIGKRAGTSVTVASANPDPPSSRRPNISEAILSDPEVTDRSALLPNSDAGVRGQ